MSQAFFCPLKYNFSTTRSGDSSLVGHPSVHRQSKVLMNFASVVVDNADILLYWGTMQTYLYSGGQCRHPSVVVDNADILL